MKVTLSLGLELETRVGIDRILNTTVKVAYLSIENFIPVKIFVRCKHLERFYLPSVFFDLTLHVFII